jgi:hypothetical protein
MIHHEDTKHTKQHEAAPPPENTLLCFFVSFLSFVPSW